MTITDKQLRDKRFRQTELKIISAFVEIIERTSISRLIKNACISRSTLYRHHKTIYNIVPDYEKYILRKYKSAIRHHLYVDNVRLKNLYIHTLSFMIVHQKIIIFLLKHDNKNLIRAMLTILQVKISSVSKITNPEILAIYISEVATVIEQWAQNGLNKEEISPTVDKIMYLTNTAHDRLSPLAGF